MRDTVAPIDPLSEVSISFEILDGTARIARPISGRGFQNSFNVFIEIRRQLSVAATIDFSESFVDFGPAHGL
jgi:hypothetical protein